MLSERQKAHPPCAAHLTGQFGLSDTYVGVPVVIGAGGVERIVEIELNASEKKMFDALSNRSTGLSKPARRSRPSWRNRSGPEVPPPGFPISAEHEKGSYLR